MRLGDFPFQIVDWSQVEPVVHKGTTGEAHWQTMNFGDVRVRIVVYTPGYEADHWCEKGHVILCLEGELRTELADGRIFVLTRGMSYQVGDGIDAHKSISPKGAKLFIVD